MNEASNMSEMPADLSESPMKSKSAERVTIDESLREKLNALTDQANLFLSGVAKVSKSDLINMILDRHETELSRQELEILRSKHLDPVKFAYWIAAHMKSSKENGEQVSFEDVLQRSQALFEKMKAPKIKRQRRLGAMTKKSEEILTDDTIDGPSKRKL